LIYWSRLNILINTCRCTFSNLLGLSQVLGNFGLLSILVSSGRVWLVGLAKHYRNPAAADAETIKVIRSDFDTVAAVMGLALSGANAMVGSATPVDARCASSVP